MNWVKLNLYYIGFSAKQHIIFRSPQWTSEHEKIVNTLIRKPLFTQEYKKYGVIKDIFGPISSPFISVKTKPDQEKLINDKAINNQFYVKMN
ncbi:MAG: H/ACA RNA-protein complex component Gar1 [Promethearchaeota archaeon]|nr:MAG: H/ACA RNA-protein complex component Gar1 [Candidatus Lokiarchaeota archaeon]